MQLAGGKPGVPRPAGPFDSAQGRLARRPSLPRMTHRMVAALVFVAGCSVVAAAGLDFVVTLFGLDLDLTGRGVAGGGGLHRFSVVLPAVLLRNLVECLA